jgi:hypothetical protein
MRYFTVAYLADREVGACLNALILWANPSEKNVAHITIGGPYEQADRARIEATLPSVRSSLAEARVRVLGCGNFFEFGQHTVFLRCDAPELRAVWDKKQYDYAPHITLYDGEDHEMAVELFKILSKQKIDFTISLGVVRLYESVKGQKSLDAAFEIDYQEAKRMMGVDFNLSTLRTVPMWQRRQVIERLAAKLSGFSYGVRSHGIVGAYPRPLAQLG